MKLPEGSGYVALGSSYAAGPGLGDRDPGSPGGASRSTHNYAHILADRLKLRLTDVSYSGATVAQILGRERGATPSPQLDAVTPDTRLVTLTGGGNDLGYIGYLFGASLPGVVRAVTGGKKRLAELADPGALERKAATLADDLRALFDGIRTRAPQATIVVTDYLTVLPTDVSVRVQPLDRERADHGRAFSSQLHLTLLDAATRANVTFVDVSAASASHHAWSNDPWTARFVFFGGKAAPYHPNRAGMVHVADAVEAALEKN